MKTHNLLRLFVYCSPKGETKVDPDYGIAQLKRAISRVEEAICNPRSQERHQLESLGFAALILIKPDQEEYAVCFDKGNCVRIRDDGRGVIEEHIMGSENVCDMLGWLNRTMDYALWVKRVHAARDAKERPPVFCTEDWIDLDHRAMYWLGGDAEAYIESWKQARRAETSAEAALSPFVEPFDTQRTVPVGAFDRTFM